MAHHRILFVCLGNICRSPMAEGVFRQVSAACGLEDRFFVDSAGTGNWHLGAPPDERAQAVLLDCGIDISGLRARQVNREDFGRFELLLAMDRSNIEDLHRIAPPDERQKVNLFLDYTLSQLGAEVPDPYYGGGFAHVLDLIERASHGLLKRLGEIE